MRYLMRAGYMGFTYSMFDNIGERCEPALAYHDEKMPQTAVSMIAKLQHRLHFRQGAVCHEPWFVAGGITSIRGNEVVSLS